MATYEQLEELLDAYRARQEARIEADRILEEAATRLRAAALATGMGPSELARELGLKSPTTAADLLKAATTGRLPRRRRPALSPEQRAAMAVKKAEKKALAAVPVLDLVTGAESDTQPADTPPLYDTLEEQVLLIA